MTACPHTFTPDPAHPGYGLCPDCGTYKSLIAPPPEQVYTADYWSHAKGHSTLAEQVHNCEEWLEGGVSKNDFLLSLIDVEDRSAALEIGCAPGALLGRLERDAGFDDVIGVEMSGVAWREELQSIAGTDCLIVFGKFPGGGDTFALVKGAFSLIIAADVFEHSHEPEAFLAECARLLKPGGQLILMLPLVWFEDEVPERMFNAEEHVYIHSSTNLSDMLRDAGFDGIMITRWCPGHECVSARRAA